MGKSSGGFGAMITPMLRPDLFGALATHAGDALYETVLHPDFGPAASGSCGTTTATSGGGGTTSGPGSRSPRPDDQVLLGLLGVAACFSAHEDGTVELPFDPRTGVLRPEVWQRWLDWDPVRMAPRYAAALPVAARDLDRRRDQGRSTTWTWARRPSGQALLEVGVAEEVIRFELFDATHAGIDYRYPLSLAWLCQRIAA